MNPAFRILHYNNHELEGTTQHKARMRSRYHQTCKEQVMFASADSLERYLRTAFEDAYQEYLDERSNGPKTVSQETTVFRDALRRNMSPESKTIANLYNWLHSSSTWEAPLVFKPPYSGNGFPANDTIYCKDGTRWRCRHENMVRLASSVLKSFKDKEIVVLKPVGPLTKLEVDAIVTNCNMMFRDLDQTQQELDAANNRLRIVLQDSETAARNTLEFFRRLNSGESVNGNATNPGSFGGFD